MQEKKLKDQKMNGKQKNSLAFKIAVPDTSSSSFSNKIEDSDFSTNQIFLNSVIGTLVKYGPSGRIEPYLADSWTVSDNKKIWTFKLRENIYTKNGDALNSNLYKKTLEGNLKRFNKFSDVIDFENLIGFQEFKKGTSPHISGLAVNNNFLIFEFSKAPSDLLELLRMPYFGFWIEDSNKNIVSTAAYEIISFYEKNVKLELKNEWFSINDHSAKYIDISYVNISDLNISMANSTIIKIPYYVNTIKNENSTLIHGLPTRFESFVLSPFKNNFFHQKQNRLAFLQKLISNTKLIKSPFMYMSAQSKLLPDVKADYMPTRSFQKLTFAIERSTYSKNEIEVLTNSLKNALPNIDFEIVFRNADKDFFKKTDSNTYFDARVATVDIGGYPDYSTLNMMFCTKLGISFPDKDKIICNLIEKFKKINPKMSMDFIKAFNQHLADEAVIIPIAHYSEKWIVSNNIELNSLPPTGMYPQFEKILVK